MPTIQEIAAAVVAQLKGSTPAAPPASSPGPADPAQAPPAADPLTERGEAYCHDCGGMVNPWSCPHGV